MDTEGNSSLPLFYTNPVPLNIDDHQDLSLKMGFGYDFTKDVNAVPINMIEMIQVSRYYPIGFSPDANATPVAILGLRNEENLFVDESGKWQDQAYIPAYIRRYPFIFSELANSDKLTLCIDGKDELFEKGNDFPFFEKGGQPSDLSNNALEFCKSYHAAAAQTVEFSRFISKTNLLVDRKMNINIGDEKKINFSGFRIIDEKKLNDLDDALFLQIKNKGYLPFLYAHIFSGSQWQNLSYLLNTKVLSLGEKIKATDQNHKLSNFTRNKIKPITKAFENISL